MTAVELPFTEAWNPYWVAFAASQGHAPAAIEGPSWNARFMAWMSARWAEWSGHVGITSDVERAGRVDEFGAWLAANYPEVSS